MPMNKLVKLRDPKGPIVQEIRNKFLKEVYMVEPENFYPQDIRLVENMDFLLQRYIIMQGKDIDASIKMLSNALKWRKKSKVYDLCESYFPQEVHLCGAAFVYEKDLFGNNTIYMRACMLRNCPELRQFMKDFMAYLFVQADDPKDGDKFAIIIDLTKTSWINYDLEILQHLTALLREYFPVNLDYILAVNLPWVFSTSWSVIKHIIPNERRNLIKFINSDQIFNYVAKENCPNFLGGTCTRSYIGSPDSSSFTCLDYVLDITNGDVTVKRLREILAQFKEVLPKSQYLKLKQQIEMYEAGRYISRKLSEIKIDLNVIESDSSNDNNNDGQVQDLNQLPMKKDM